MNYFIQGNQNPFLFNKDNYNLNNTHRKIKEDVVELPEAECSRIKMCSKQDIVDRVNILYLYIKIKFPIVKAGIFNFSLYQNSEINEEREETDAEGNTTLVKGDFVCTEDQKLHNEIQYRKKANFLKTIKETYKELKNINKQIAFYDNVKEVNLHKYQELLTKKNDLENIIDLNEQEIDKLGTNLIFNFSYVFNLNYLNFNETNSYAIKTDLVDQIMDISIVENTSLIRFNISASIYSKYTFNGYNIYELNNMQFNLLNYTMIKVVLEYLDREKNACLDIRYDANKIQEIEIKKSILYELCQTIKRSDDEELKAQLSIKESELVDEINKLQETLFTNKITTVLGIYKVHSNEIIADEIKIPIDINSPFMLYFRDENDNLIDIENFIIHF